jgi:hypothetical protein
MQAQFWNVSVKEVLGGQNGVARRSVEWPANWRTRLQPGGPNGQVHSEFPIYLDTGLLERGILVDISISSLESTSRAQYNYS